MPYNKKKLYEQAINIATNKKCFFIEQVVSFMSCEKPTFYKYFKPGSNELNAIKDLLEANRIEVKSAMYKKWFDSDNPTLQISLMKIIGNEHDAKRLNNSKDSDNDQKIVIKVENKNE